MSEVAALLGSLNGQRRHVLGILEGLDEEELRRPLLPSGWTCLGLVRHLAIDVERFWFQHVVVGEAAPGRQDAWKVGPETAAKEVFDDYRRECERAEAIIAASSLDGPVKWWPAELFGHWRLESVREVVLHVISETACHAGHLDAARELIDGRQWIVHG